MYRLLVENSLCNATVLCIDLRGYSIAALLHLREDAQSEVNKEIPHLLKKDQKESISMEAINLLSPWVLYGHYEFTWHSVV